jgi:hypothetical protein
MGLGEGRFLDLGLWEEVIQGGHPRVGDERQSHRRAHRSEVYPVPASTTYNRVKH